MEQIINHTTRAQIPVSLRCAQCDLGITERGEAICPSCKEDVAAWAARTAQQCAEREFRCDLCNETVDTTRAQAVAWGWAIVRGQTFCRECNDAV